MFLVFLIFISILLYDIFFAFFLFFSTVATISLSIVLCHNYYILSFQNLICRNTLSMLLLLLLTTTSCGGLGEISPLLIRYLVFELWNWKKI